MVTKGPDLTKAVFEIGHVQWAEIDHTLAISHGAALPVGLVSLSPQRIHLGIQSGLRPHSNGRSNLAGQILRALKELHDVSSHEFIP